ncbi:unnamed protein product [Oikopleura dioica]|uniref:Uncharacterized protein n=1 Tax=Oikopleura dioica TaxID=34765 RepID=E4Y9G8_OIKDI|nr:unnamed protein product [Oikopleura dioica]
MRIKKKYCKKKCFLADLSIFKYFLAAKLRHLSSRSLIVGQSVNFLELERQRIDHERRSASNFRSLPQRRRKNLKSLEDLKGEIQHKEMLRLLRNFNDKFIEKPKHKYHLLVPSVAPRVLDPDEYDDSHDQDSDRAIIEKFNLIKRQLPKLTEQAKLKEETLEREKLHKTRHPGSVKLLRYVRSDKPRKYEIELTNIFADEKAHATSRPVSIK